MLRAGCTPRVSVELRPVAAWTGPDQGLHNTTNAPALTAAGRDGGGGLFGGGGASGSLDLGDDELGLGDLLLSLSKLAGESQRPNARRCGGGPSGAGRVCGRQPCSTLLCRAGTEAAVAAAEGSA